MHRNALPSAAAAPAMFSELGHITRQLHESLEQLGVMPRLQDASQGLPDARSRLEYIAAKTGEAAERVLTLVDDAKAERSALAATLLKLARGTGDARGDNTALIVDANMRLQRIDAMLTEIMLAQDFHDLTGQVVRKVVVLASELEDSLVKLLLQAAPSPARAAATSATLEGPVVKPHGRTDAASSQSL